MTDIPEKEEDTGKRRNPELEEIRDNVLTTARDHESDTRELAKLLANVHAAYLFHSKGRPALKAICTVISSTTPSSSFFASWKDLAAALGFSFYQIGCIQNYNHADFTECVLMAFAQRENATLGTIVDELVNLERFDAISTSKEHLIELYNLAMDDEYKYQHISPSANERLSDNKIIKPEGFKKLQSQVLITLRDFGSEGTSVKDKSQLFDTELRMENEIQTSAIMRPPSTHRKCKCNVMLTFAEDGRSIAIKTAQLLRQGTDTRPPIGVLVLEDHRERVLLNAENFIMHYFDQMNYIMPILTKGYFEELGNSRETILSVLEPVDPQYVQYIHDLISKYYIGNQCRNKKIRCILPRSDAKFILSLRHMKIDPALKAYVYDDEVEELARRILRIHD